MKLANKNCNSHLYMVIGRRHTYRKTAVFPTTISVTVPICIAISSVFSRNHFVKCYSWCINACRLRWNILTARMLALIYNFNRVLQDSSPPCLAEFRVQVTSVCVNHLLFVISNCHLLSHPITLVYFIAPAIRERKACSPERAECLHFVQLGLVNLKVGMLPNQTPTSSVQTSSNVNQNLQKSKRRCFPSRNYLPKDAYI